MKKIILSLALILTGTLIYAQDFSIPVEVNGGYIDFDNGSRFRDTWYVGGAAGLDFSENAGIRGYYWRALEDGQLDEFTDLEIFGAESKVKVPISKSLKPYLVVGGGILAPFNDYVDVNGEIENDNHFFGSAGAGLDLNFIRFVSVTGYARAMVSDFSQVNTLDNDINTSWNYGASVNVNLFQSKRNKEEQATQTVVMPEPKGGEIIEEQKEEINNLEEEVKELEERIDEIEEERKREKELDDLKREIKQELYWEINRQNNNGREIIDEIDLGNSQKKKRVQEEEVKQSRIEKKQDKLDVQIEEVEDKIVVEDKKDILDDKKQELEDARGEDKIQKKAEKLDKKNNKLKADANKVQLLNREYLTELQKTVSRDQFQTEIENVEIGNGDLFKDRLFYNYTSGFLGGGFGQDGYEDGLIGIKSNFYIAGSSFRLAPEISTGTNSSLNLIANGIKDININNDNFSPYVGAGAGFIMPNSDFTPTINLQAGSQINNLLDGKINAEIATRNFFNYNQISVGYELF